MSLARWSESRRTRAGAAAVFAALPPATNANAAVAGDVLTGKVFWGLKNGDWGQQSGTANISANPASVPKTGADDLPSYTEVAGEDGHASMRKGVAWPNPRFTDNGDGTVTDNLTSLIWLKNANVPNATREWGTALSDVAQLNTDGTMNGNSAEDTSNGGSHQTDWRLPNVQELQSLIDYGLSYLALCDTVGTGQWSAGDPFNNVQSSASWSTTTYAASMTPAWPVNPSNGHVHNANKTGTNCVWPVRGGE